VQIIVKIVSTLTSWQTLAQILAGGLTVFASWYGGKVLVKWVQAYRTQRTKEESERIKRESEELNKKANSESDRLKEIEGR
jgi:hypothetical protein